MILRLLVFVICFFVHTCHTAYSGRVLLISMDGFRYDYLDRVRHKPNFNRMAREGVKAKYINTAFTTSTFPNHYTLVTGLYEESHGIVGNSFYDPNIGEKFSMGKGSTDSKWWTQGEPVWITARKQGKNSATYFWPGSEVELQGFRPNFYKPYDKKTVFRDRVDEVTQWFTSKEIDVATLYFYEPDSTGHKYGPDSEWILGKIEDLDAVLGYLLDTFEKYELLDKVNIILTSDHGMTNIDPKKKMINISKFVNMSALVQSVPVTGTMSHVIPKQNKTMELYDALKNAHPNMTVYLKKDIPERLHYKHNSRISEIVIMPDEGWQVVNYNASWTYVGGHGYDNDLMNMKAFFLARGPNFKKGFVSEPFDSVDVYPLTCKLAGLTPAPNNGSLTVVSKFIKDSPESSPVPTTDKTNGASSFRYHLHGFIVAAFILVDKFFENGKFFDPTD